MPDLDTLLTEAAEAAERDGVEINGEPYGPVHAWARQNVNYRADQEFWIVTLLTAELADREARRQGFKNQADRAISQVRTKFPDTGNNHGFRRLHR
jgi:hypothetical protein